MGSPKWKETGWVSHFGPPGLITFTRLVKEFLLNCTSSRKTKTSACAILWK